MDIGKRTKGCAPSWGGGIPRVAQGAQGVDVDAVQSPLYICVLLQQNLLHPLPTNKMLSCDVLHPPQ